MNLIAQPKYILILISLFVFNLSNAQQSRKELLAKIKTYKVVDTLSVSQKIDFYNQEIRQGRATNNDEQCAYTYFNKGFFLYRLKTDVDTTKLCYEKAILFAKKNNEDFLLSILYARYGKFLAIQEENTKALPFCDSAIVASKKVKYDYATFEGHFTKSRINIALGHYDRSLQNIHKAQEYAVDSRDSVSAIKRLAAVYYYNKDYQKAETYNKQVIDYLLLRKTRRDSAFALQSMGNLADLYDQMDLQDKRKLQLDKSVKYLAYVPNEKYMKANIYKQLADYHLEVSNIIDSSAHYLAIIDKELPEIHELGFLANVNETRGTLAFKKGEYEKAVTFFKKTYDFYKKANHLQKIRGNAFNLSSSLEKANKPKEALYYLREFHKANDSINDKNKIEKFKEIELNNQFQKEKYETALAHQKDIAEEKEAKNWLIFGLIAVLGISGFVIYSFIRKKKQAKILEEKNRIINKQLDEKQLLLKEIHHRVKNNFQIVASLLELQSKGIEDQKALELAKEGKNRVKSMALIHQRLYQNDDLLIELDEYIQMLVEDISKTYGKKSTTKVTYNIPNYKFDIDTAIPLGLIINELITNAYKYGFTSTEQLLDISINKINTEEYVLEVKDNGLGLPKEFNFNKAKSLGLRLVRQLAKQLHGKTIYTNENGCSFKVSFKDTNARMLVE
ncbi:tetratricopeptide repeat-containing sensor histidine kinase [Kordia sp.]|uniref:tetratricopeptide repeat-containing sensor histidine kinase n=1 Tax=Kordia sp. TaxID=1965332 RepID=UPI003B5B0369